MTHNAGTTLDKQNWMSHVLDVHRLKLTEIVWPGAHNAGMDKQAPNYDVVVGNWTTCQNDSFAWQLANGARAFDIRLGYRGRRPADLLFSSQRIPVPSCPR